MQRDNHLQKLLRSTVSRSVSLHDGCFYFACFRILLKRLPWHGKPLRFELTRHPSGNGLSEIIRTVKHFTVKKKYG